MDQDFSIQVHGNLHKRQKKEKEKYGAFSLMGAFISYKYLLLLSSSYILALASHVLQEFHTLRPGFEMGQTRSSGIVLLSVFILQAGLTHT